MQPMRARRPRRRVVDRRLREPVRPACGRSARRFGRLGGRGPWPIVAVRTLAASAAHGVCWSRLMLWPRRPVGRGSEAAWLAVTIAGGAAVFLGASAVARLPRARHAAGVLPSRRATVITNRRAHSSYARAIRAPTRRPPPSDRSDVRHADADAVAEYLGALQASGEPPEILSRHIVATSTDFTAVPDRRAALTPHAPVPTSIVVYLAGAACATRGLRAGQRRAPPLGPARALPSSGPRRASSIAIPPSISTRRARPRPLPRTLSMRRRRRRSSRRPTLRRPRGVRDRAVLELLYATGHARLRVPGADPGGSSICSAGYVVCTGKGRQAAARAGRRRGARSGCGATCREMPPARHAAPRSRAGSS